MVGYFYSVYEKRFRPIETQRYKMRLINENCDYMRYNIHFASYISSEEEINNFVVSYKHKAEG
jgi:hypothetical protein